jgi:hypothetical protein
MTCAPCSTPSRCSIHPCPPSPPPAPAPLAPFPQGDFDLSPVLNAVVRYPRQDTLARRSQAITAAQRLLQLDLYEASAAVGPPGEGLVAIGAGSYKAAAGRRQLEGGG